MDLTKDKMITAYRNHVQPIGMGVDPKRVMAELLGKVTGTSKGMGGSMHIFLKSIVLWRSRNCRRTNSVGAGLAFADKYFETGGVTMTYFGDGAARQGSLHEALIWLCYGNFRLFYCGEQWLRDGNISRKNG
jgi:pyruvate dehydrogenase E1 component alpha subunit